jgi:hypothetical protein
MNCKYQTKEDFMHQTHLELPCQEAWELTYEVSRVWESGVLSKFEGHLNIDGTTEAEIGGYIVNLDRCRISKIDIVAEADKVDAELCKAMTVAFDCEGNTVIAFQDEFNLSFKNKRALFIDRLTVGLKVKGRRIGLALIKDACEALALSVDDLIFLRVHPWQFDGERDLSSDEVIRKLNLDRKRGIRKFNSAQERLKRYFSRAGFKESPRDANYMYLPHQVDKSWWRVPTIRYHHV